MYVRLRYVLSIHDTSKKSVFLGNLVLWSEKHFSENDWPWKSKSFKVKNVGGVHSYLIPYIYVPSLIEALMSRDIKVTVGEWEQKERKGKKKQSNKNEDFHWKRKTLITYLCTLFLNLAYISIEVNWNKFNWNTIGCS